MTIPKIIHYCWYGNKPIPKRLQYCINTWKVYLPEYTFMKWDESNTDFDCDFVKKAYQAEKWAFVSDYIRLKAVYEYGGIYLDTDMLLLKPLDDFLENECFFVAEHIKSIGVGVFGAIKKNNFIKLCLASYHKEDAIFLPIPAIVSREFLDMSGFQRYFKDTVTYNNIVVYKPDYFYALPYDKLFDIHNYAKYITNDSYGIHLWEGSWHSYNEFILLRRKEYLKAFKRTFKSVFKEKKINKKYVIKWLRAFRDSLIIPNAFK